MTIRCDRVNNRSNIWRSRRHHCCYAKDDHLFYLAKFLHWNWKINPNKINLQLKSFCFYFFEILWISRPLPVLIFYSLGCVLSITSDCLIHGNYFPDFLYSDEALRALQNSNWKNENNVQFTGITCCTVVQLVQCTLVITFKMNRVHDWTSRLYLDCVVIYSKSLERRMHMRSGLCRMH